MASNPAVNVVKRGQKWAVIRDEGQRAHRVVATQGEAIEIGRRVARNERVELRIQDEHGRWRDSDSYGNDPAPPIDQVR